MKWTPIQVEALKELCMAGLSNATIAEHFGVPVTEIHAKRSALGITIPKVKAMQGKAPLIVNQELEAAVQEMDQRIVSKAEFVDKLEDLLRAAGELVTLELLNNETIMVCFPCGSKTVDIACDSHIAIIKDVIRQAID